MEHLTPTGNALTCFGLPRVQASFCIPLPHSRSHIALSFSVAFSTVPSLVGKVSVFFV